MTPPPVILSRPDRLGDVVISTSVIAPFRAALPETPLAFLVAPNLTSLLRDHPGIDRLIPAPRFNRQSLSRRTLIWRSRLRREAAGGIVHLHPDPALHIGSALAGIPVRIGYRRAGASFLTESVRYRRHRGDRHEAVCNFDLLERLGVELPAKPTPWIEGNFPSRMELINRFPDCGLERHYAVLHPAAFGDKPRWPAGHYGELAQRLIRDHHLTVIIAGGAVDEDAWTCIRGTVDNKDHRHLHDLAGQTSLRELTSLLRDASLYVGRDTGPSHLAAALGTPTVNLMGQCDPKHAPARWKTLGPRTETLISNLPPQKGETRFQRWDRCFAAITVDEVLTAAQGLGALP